MTTPLDPTVAPDSHEDRTFVETYIAQARAATARIDKPGVVQMILVHPNDDDVTRSTVMRSMTIASPSA
jgi:hypothetical protein